MLWFSGRKKHEKLRALLSAYIDGELKAYEKELVEKHLLTCSSCHQELESLGDTVSLLKSRPLRSPSRSFFLEAQKKPQPRPIPPIWLPVPVPVIITVLIMLALFAGDFLQLHSLQLSKKAPSYPAPAAVTASRASGAMPQTEQIAAAEKPIAISEAPKALETATPAPQEKIQTEVESFPRAPPAVPEAAKKAVPAASAAPRPEGAAVIAKALPVPAPVPERFLPAKPGLEPSIALSPGSGLGTIPIEGKGFTPGSQIIISWEGKELPTVPATITADNEGKFTAVASVLEPKAGEYTISASQPDFEPNRAEARFIVPQMPPVAVVPGPAGPAAPPGPPGLPPPKTEPVPVAPSEKAGKEEPLIKAAPAGPMETPALPAKAAPYGEPVKEKKTELKIDRLIRTMTGPFAGKKPLVIIWRLLEILLTIFSIIFVASMVLKRKGARRISRNS